MPKTLPYRLAAGAVLITLLPACGTDTPTARPPESTALPTTPPVTRPTLTPVLGGERKIVVRVAEANRDLSATYEGPVATGDGTDDGSLFRILPAAGGRFLIESLRPREEASRFCVSVTTATSPASLGTVECAETPETLFTIEPTGRTDTKGQPTQRISSTTYGSVRWDQQTRQLYVRQPGDTAAGASFGFVDRGKA